MNTCTRFASEEAGSIFTAASIPLGVDVGKRREGMGSIFGNWELGRLSLHIKQQASRDEIWCLQMRCETWNKGEQEDHICTARLPDLPWQFMYSMMLLILLPRYPL